MNLDDFATLSAVGVLAASLLGFILFVLIWYWIIRLAVTHAIRRTDEERESRARRTRVTTG